MNRKGREQEEIERAFSQAFASLDRRINLFLSLPIGTLDKFVLQGELDKIGKKIKVKEPPMKTVIFACVHNAGRSQIAATFFNLLADRSNAQAVSAGTRPGLRVHPEVLAVMKEIGIDLSNAKPQKLTEELAREAWLLVTMGCGDKCPYVPGLRRDDWSLRDPKGLSMDQVRLIRDEIKERVRALLKSESLVSR